MICFCYRREFVCKKHVKKNGRVVRCRRVAKYVYRSDKAVMPLCEFHHNELTEYTDYNRKNDNGNDSPKYRYSIDKSINLNNAFDCKLVENLNDSI
jgi:hypothetical protein